MKLSDEERIARASEAQALTDQLAAYKSETKELAAARKGREAAMAADIARLHREAGTGESDDEQLEIPGANISDTAEPR